MSSPFFSIALPTRNRVNLLRRALQSILWQSFHDYEVIVFDNASEDDTPDCVREFDDPRIRYIRSEKWINVQEAYEQAFKAANGKFLHAMGDDDALLPHCLKRSKEIIEKYKARLLCFSVNCVYFYPDWIEETKRNTLRLATFTYEEEVLDSNAELRSIFEFGLNYCRHPIVTNAFFQKTDIDDLMNKHGQILLNDHFGDISIAVFLLDLTDHYVFVDEPLHVAGFSGRSNSANQIVMARSLDLESLDEEFKMWFSDEQKMNHLLQGVPLKIPIEYNLSTATLLQQKAMLDLQFEFNWSGYFKTMWITLAYLESAGVDISSAKEGLFRALSQYSLLRALSQYSLLRALSQYSLLRALSQYSLLRALSQYSLRVRFKWFVLLLSTKGRILTYISLLRRKRSILRYMGHLLGIMLEYFSPRRSRTDNLFLIITGREGGFNDILGAVKYVDHLRINQGNTGER